MNDLQTSAGGPVPYTPLTNTISCSRAGLEVTIACLKDRLNTHPAAILEYTIALLEESLKGVVAAHNVLVGASSRSVHAERIGQVARGFAKISREFR